MNEWYFQAVKTRGKCLQLENTKSKIFNKSLKKTSLYSTSYQIKLIESNLQKKFKKFQTVETGERKIN